MARIHRTSRLDKHNAKVVCHKEVVGFMHLVESTGVNVVMAR